MKLPGPDAPVVLVKWYDDAKWLLERVENFPKSQRFVLGQRLVGQALDVLDLLVEASYTREKTETLAITNRKLEVRRGTADGVYVRASPSAGSRCRGQAGRSPQPMSQAGRLLPLFPRPLLMPVGQPR